MVSAGVETYTGLHDRLASNGFREARSLEFKRGLAWNEIKHTVTKAVLAMSNLEGGGRIVIGVDRNDNGGHTMAGMGKEVSQTFREDEVSEFVNKYADPPVQVRIQGVSQEGRYFVVIDVPEFDHQPILCKKDLDKEGKKHLESGRLYYRPKGGIKSTSRITHQDLRDLLDFAVVKHYNYWAGQLRKLSTGAGAGGQSAGGQSAGGQSAERPSHSDFFDKEASDF